MAAKNAKEVIELLDSDSDDEQDAPQNKTGHDSQQQQQQQQQTIKKALESGGIRGSREAEPPQPALGMPVLPPARVRRRCIQEEKREIDESDDEESVGHYEVEKQASLDTTSDESSSSSSSSSCSSSSSSSSSDDEAEPLVSPPPAPAFGMSSLSPPTRIRRRCIQEEKQEIEKSSDDESEYKKQASRGIYSKRRAKNPPPPQEEPLRKRRPPLEGSFTNKDLIHYLLPKDPQADSGNDPDDNEEAGSSDDEAEDEAIRRKYSKAHRIAKPIEKPAAATKRDHLFDSDLLDPGEFAMDCAICRCGGNKRPNQIIDDDIQRLHRACCHNVEYREGVQLFTELIKAREQAVQKAHGLKGKATEERELNRLKPDYVKKRRKKRLEPKPISKSDLIGLQSAACMRETKLINLYEFPCPDGIAYSHPQYTENCIKLNRLIKEAATLKDGKEEGITVLDCFAGIGTLLVVLKRLGIRIQKYIYVDMDPIAKHVFRHNHDPAYEGNETLKSCKGSAGIVFDYYEKFEDIRDDLDGFMEKHGPIDVIVGGPPCQEFSQVNANRVGVRNSSGHLFVDFGHFITRAMGHTQQKGTPLWYFAENVEIKQDDLALVEKAFSDSPFFLLDACYWSPCSRKRGFFSNLQCPKSHTKWEEIGATKCLEREWWLPGDVFRHDPNSLVSKSNTFMASLGRIDDKRMTVVKMTTCGGYRRRTFKVVEREKMMGFPPGYVERPVNELYDALHPSFTSLDKDYKWEKGLQKKYHVFAGSKVKLIGLGCFDGDIDRPCIELKLCPPQTGKTPSFFHADEYSKHLIGNAYSVPVAVALISPLKRLFQSVEYKGYEYEYAWGCTDEYNTSSP